MNLPDNTAAETEPQALGLGNLTEAERLEDQPGDERRCGVDDGIRTHDHRNHNPALYLLSYAHHRVRLMTDKPVKGVTTIDGQAHQAVPQQ